jgi:co-chaperonin GroES (HSP10)
MRMSSKIPLPVGWKVIVRPKKGKTTTEGGLDVSATVDAQEHLVYLGEIVAVGEAAFMTKTAGGLNMSEWRVRPQVGDFCIFSPYGGLQIRPSGEKQKLLLMNDTDIHAIVDDPDDYYSWVDV